MNIELIGHISAAITILAILQADVYRLRIMSIISSGLFMYYGFKTNAYPIVVVNMFIFSISVYHFLRLRKLKCKL